MIDKEIEEWNNVLKWLEEKHPGFESNLSLRDLPGLERGMTASKDLKKGETLLHIPSTCMLNPLTLLPNSLIPSHLFPQSVSRNNPNDSTTPISKKARMEKGRKLDTTQLLTLHLALTKDSKNRYKSNWKEYIESLPKTFRPWHPLTWVVSPILTQKENVPQVEWKWFNHLYDIGLSQAAKLKVQDVKKRFDEEYEILVEVLTEEEPFKSQNLVESIDKEVILWAWLNVNTRSISIPLGLPSPSERNNHTLVPIMDFINHSSNEKIVTPRVKQVPTASSRIRKLSMSTKSNGSKSDIALPSPPLTTNNGNTTMGLRKADQHLLPNKIDFKLVCQDNGLKKDEEVFFEYGGHSSSTLFAEYGFCEIPVQPNLDSQNGTVEHHESENGIETNEQVVPEEDGWLNMKYGEVDLTHYVSELWENQNEEDKEEKKQVLEDIGCWGGNTIHCQPSPVHPSHSLLMTLRLIHLPSNSPKLTNISRGLVTYVSPANENSTMMTLESILKKVIKDSQKRHKSLKKLVKYPEPENGKILTSQQIGIIKMLCSMCDEEQILSQSLLERIESGVVDFP